LSSVEFLTASWRRDSYKASKKKPGQTAGGSSTTITTRPQKDIKVRARIDESQAPACWTAYAISTRLCLALLGGRGSHKNGGGWRLDPFGVGRFAAITLLVLEEGGYVSTPTMFETTRAALQRSSWQRVVPRHSWFRTSAGKKKPFWKVRATA